MISYISERYKDTYQKANIPQCISYLESLGTCTNVIFFWFLVLEYINNGIMSPKEMITIFLKHELFWKNYFKYYVLDRTIMFNSKTIIIFVEMAKFHHLLQEISYKLVAKKMFWKTRTTLFLVQNRV